MSNAEVVSLSKTDLVSWMKGDDIAADDDTDDIMYDQALRILEADNAAEVLRDDEVVKSESLVGKSFVVTGVSWRKSTKNENGPGRYAFMTCADENGERFLTSCGATKVVLQLRKAELEGWLPWQVQLDAVETNAGRTMLQLVAPTEPF